jgi:hypothetical protein
MKTKTTPQSDGVAAPNSNPARRLLRLAASNTPPVPQRNAPNPVAIRRNSVRQRLTAHLDDDDTAPIAAVLVSLRADGTVDLVTADVEPEFAEALSDGLATAVQRVRSHGRIRASRSDNESGAATLFALIPLTFIAATYLNDVAWIDAVLSAAAQVTASFLSRRRP